MRIFQRAVGCLGFVFKVGVTTGFGLELGDGECVKSVPALVTSIWAAHKYICVSCEWLRIINSLYYVFR